MSNELTLINKAIEINTAHQHAIQHADTAIAYARKAGKLLTQVKATLPHGAFLPWVEKNCTVSPRQAQRYMSAAQGKPMPVRKIKNDIASHLVEKPEIEIPIGSTGYVEWTDSQRNRLIFEVHSFLFPDGKTLGIRTVYGMSGPHDLSSLYCEYDRRGINASYCSIRKKAEEYGAPVDQLHVFEGQPTYWDTLHQMDLLDARKGGV